MKFCVAAALAELQALAGDKFFVTNEAGKDDVKEAVEKLTASVGEKMKEMQAVKAKMDDETKEHGKHREETAARLEALVKENAAVNAKILELQQKGVRTSGDDRPMSMGAEFVESAAFKNYKGGRQGICVEVRNDVTSAGTSAGALIAPDRKDLIITPPDRILRIRSLCMSGSTTSNLVQYQKEDVFTSAVAGVAEGAAYPKSNVKYSPADAKVKKFGHMIKVTKEALDDSAQLQSLIDSRLRYGVLFREDEQLLLGDGTGNDVLGVMPQAASYDTDRTETGDNMADIISHAMTQAISDEYYASGLVLNPNDWEKMRLLKTTDGVYLFAGPQQLPIPTVWGLPVVVTNAMPVGKFLTGAFAIGSQIFDRAGVEIEISTENADDFERDLVSMKCSQRLAFVVYRPKAFVVGQFPS
ncbi:MAG: phage major capsid protein [Burkholderiales bacterium]|jgi:HK97 family phage major capsid protein|nr:phage major capsid protein [Burkholderiales bacterium]